MFSQWCFRKAYCW